MQELTSAEIKHMHELARNMLDKAYAPYSKFQVGVALKTKNGNYYSGCNIENASYSLVQCAEACAIATMVASGEQHIVAISVVSSGDKLCSPCGACRQRLREFAPEDIVIYMYDGQDNYQVKKLSELLPLSFGPENLMI